MPALTPFAWRSRSRVIVAPTTTLSPSSFARSRWSLPSTPSVAPLPRRTTLTRSGVTFLVIRPQTVPLGLPPFRSALPFRLRCASAASPGAATPFAPDSTDLAEPRTAPSRYANGAAGVAADPRPGVPVAPSAPRPHYASFRSPDRHRLLDCPAHNVSRPKPIPARRDAVTRFRARQGGCSPSAADSPSHNDSGPPLARLARFRLMRRGLRCSPRTTRLEQLVCGSFAKLTHDPTRTRAINAESPPLATGQVPRPHSRRSGFTSVTAKALALRQPPALGLRRVPRPSSESCR